jgi:hypothetical protein
MSEAMQRLRTMKPILDIAISFDLQGLELVDEIIFFDFLPLGISYMGHKCRRFLYIFILFFVIGVSWSVDEVK